MPAIQVDDHFAINLRDGHPEAIRAAQTVLTDCTYKNLQGLTLNR